MTYQSRDNKLKDGTIDLKFGIINLTNEPAPRVFDAPDFSFDPGFMIQQGELLLSIQYQL